MENGDGEGVTTLGISRSSYTRGRLWMYLLPMPHPFPPGRLHAVTMSREPAHAWHVAVQQQQDDLIVAGAIDHVQSHFPRAGKIQPIKDLADFPAELLPESGPASGSSSTTRTRAVRQSAHDVAPRAGLTLHGHVSPWLAKTMTCRWPAAPDAKPSPGPDPTSPAPAQLARKSQCAPTARFTSGGRIHPGSCR